VNAYTLISAVMTEHLDLAPTDSNNSGWRTKILGFQQEIVDEVCNEEVWDFMQSQTTVSLTAATSSVSGPSDISTTSENGAVFIRVSGDDRKRLRYLPPPALFDLLETNGSGTGEPEFYTVAQQDATFIPKLHFDKIANQTYTISIYYERNPPTLTDTDGTSSGLQTIPARYHRSVIYKGVVARVASFNSAANASKLEADYRMALGAMKARRNQSIQDTERVAEGLSAWQMH
jgi:hypothetical protein